VQLPENMLNKAMVAIFERAELLIYGLIGALLVVIALLSVAAAVNAILTTPSLGSSLLALNHVFITIIVAELLVTVIDYIKHRTVNLKLILGAGITAMIRRLLILGVEPIAFEELVIVLIAIVILIGGMRFISDISVET
jgi:uncharacterized membrane protein (DUF373 family)